jgi:hypothetical protein
MDDLFAFKMIQMRSVSRKRVLVAEVGSSPDGGNKQKWVREGYEATYARFRKIKAVVYFNVNAKELVNQEDWRLTTPAGAMAAYRNTLAKPQFQGTIP